MTKQELLSTYTAEQLAEMVVECETVKKQYEISTNWEKTMPEHELKAKFNQETEKIKCENERLKTTINQIDGILEELFGVKHDAVKYGEFEQFLRDKVTEKASNFLPAEPIKVADMLISAAYTRKKGDMEKALHKAFGNNEDTFTESVYSVSELRQIAEHLLIYCNHNEEDENAINR